MSHTDYTTGDIDLKVKLTSEKEVSIDDLVNEANDIWKYAKARRLKFGDSAGAERLMADVQAKHPQFCHSYPIVNRYICEMQQYSTKAFRMWLMKIKEHPWKGENEYLDAQADYIVMLYKVKAPRANMTQVNQFRAQIRALLQVEHEKFKHYVNEFDKEVSAEESVLKKKNANELHKFVLSAGPKGMALAETIRVSHDTPTAARVDDLITEKISSLETIRPEFSAEDLL
jgi:hypothetical protein